MKMKTQITMLAICLFCTAGFSAMTISQLTPASGTQTQDNTVQFKFKYVDANDATANCTLYINNAKTTTFNASTMNNTLTTLTRTLDKGTSYVNYVWKIECIGATNSANSTLNTIRILGYGGTYNTKDVAPAVTDVIGAGTGVLAKAIEPILYVTIAGICLAVMFGMLNKAGIKNTTGKQ